MFVKIYRYKLKRTNLQKWKKNNDTVGKIYKRYCGEFKRLIKRDKKFVHVVEIGFYKSKSEFKRIIKKFDNDPKVNVLFKEFLSLIHNSKFSEEEFETV